MPYHKVTNFTKRSSRLEKYQMLSRSTCCNWWMNVWVVASPKLKCCLYSVIPVKPWPDSTIVRLLYFIGTLRLVNGCSSYIVYWLSLLHSRWRIFWYRKRATMSCVTLDLPQLGMSVKRKIWRILIILSSMSRVQNPEKQGISTVDEDIKKYTTLSYRSGSETDKAAFWFVNLSELRRW